MRESGHWVCPEPECWEDEGLQMSIYIEKPCVFVNDTFEC